MRALNDSLNTMNDTPHPASGTSSTTRRPPLLLALTAFLLGAGLAGLWLQRHHAGAGDLTSPTREKLAKLAAPVTIRNYAMLPGDYNEPLRSYASRVSELLAAMQTASGGKIQIVNVVTPAETNASAAGADGIQGFNVDKGDASFLGLVIASGKQRETFSRLQPEWEPALKYDLARAILRVAGSVPPPPPEIAKPSPEILDSIRQLVPDVKATSEADADQIFHAEFVKQCIQSGTEMETQIKIAQLQVVQAQNSGTPEQVAAARKNLSHVELAQADKIKQAAARLQLQTEIFKRMKTGAQ